MESKDIFYRRNLPHIHPDGYPLFITFRLADSLPADVLSKLKTEREQALRAQPSLEERYKIEKLHFGRYDKWLDCCVAGPRWLEDTSIANIVADKIHSMDDGYFQLIAYCIMLNHVHLLIQSMITEQPQHQGTTAKYPVVDSLRLLKGSTARACNLKLERSGQFWSHESYDHYVRDADELERIVKYILYNPVKAGLVKEWKQWQFTYINPDFGTW